MPHKNDIKTLILNKSRRLQKLKEMQALRGLDTPAHILTEIEDIEAEIENLQVELTQEVKSLDESTVPVEKKVEQDEKNKKVSWTPQSIAVVITAIAGVIAAIGGIIVPLYTSGPTSTPVYTPTDAALITSTDTPPPPNPTSTMIPTELPTSTPTLNKVETTPNWINLVRIDLSSSSCDPKSPLPFITANQNSEEALSRLKQAFEDKDKYSWALVPPNTDGIINTTFRITNISKEPEWMQLDHSMTVTVSFLLNSPEYVNTIVEPGCGGGAMIKEFSSVNLVSDYKTYNNIVINSEFDYFTLQPGEPEVFNLKLECNAPGTYSIGFDIPYVYLGKDGHITYNDALKILCPKFFSIWNYGGGTFLGSENYIWNGTAYDKAQQ